MEPQRVQASRVGEGSIRIDGRMDEEEWSRASPVRGFVQSQPEEGAPSRGSTEVRFLFSDEALYVGARLRAPGPDVPIRAPLGRRDERGLADHLIVSLDTYRDRRTAWSFGITASGVRIDHHHRSDREEDIDPGFDPVWEARTSIGPDGWVAEMWIPFSQLRFTDQPEQVWGLNVQRWIPALNESSYWVPVPNTVEAWASRFGALEGIRDIPSSRRVELLPYVAAGSALNGDRDPSDPFDDGRNLEGRAGLDLKMGLGPNLTLDATMFPDFGQVEVDPAVVNLSATETFYEERRPFFTEGIRLVGGNVINHFYSRRIGAPPLRIASGDHVEYPRDATILGAGKLTGRLPGGTSIGVLGALTGEESARTFDVERMEFGRVAVAPRTGWGVARVQQEFGSAGSTASLLVAGVRRGMDPGSTLAGLLPRDALTLAGESLWRIAGGRYELALSGGMTRVAGDPSALLRLQRASQRYFQRPDAGHVEVDPELRSMSGYKATAQFRRTSGTHWLWDVFFDLETPTVEFNDIGRLGAADGIQARQNLVYRETRPGRIHRGYRFAVQQFSEWNFEGDRQFTRLLGRADWTWRNFWRTQITSETGLRGTNWALTRGGPLMATPRGWAHGITLRNGASARTQWGASGGWGENELGGWGASASFELSVQPSPRLSLALGPSVQRESDPRQYVATRGGGSPANFGIRSIFATIDRTTLAVEARTKFALHPDLAFDFYAQPFAASGRYSRHGELARPGALELREYGTDGTRIEAGNAGGIVVVDGADRFELPNRDFRLRSFRSTAVLRWEWSPGSTLYLVWQQDRSRSGASGDPVGVRDLLSAARTTGSHYLAVKASYWIGG